jgi:hypothetical protein
MRPQIAGALRNGKPYITALSGDMAGGSVAFTGEVCVGSTNAPQRAELRVNNVSVAGVMELLAWFRDTSVSSAAAPAMAKLVEGKVSGLINLHWSGQNTEAFARNLEGTVSLDLTDATVSDQELLEKLQEVLGLSSLGNLVIRQGHLEGIISGGKLQVANHRLTGPDVELAATGYIDLLSRQLELKLDVSLAPALFPGGRNAMDLAQMILPKTSASKESASTGQLIDKMSLPQITVSGTLDNPIVRLANAELNSPAMMPSALNHPVEQESLVRERLLAGSH